MSLELQDYVFEDSHTFIESRISSKFYAKERGCMYISTGDGAENYKQNQILSVVELRYNQTMKYDN